MNEKQPSMRTKLALSGGMALGAYAAGAYEALSKSEHEPQLISGASVGAILAALIAGNPPDRRLSRIREFWDRASAGSFSAANKVWYREAFNAMNVAQTLSVGRPGIFKPRLSGLLSLLPWTPPSSSLFDPTPIVATLESLIDFDLLNTAAPPIIVACVDVRSGEPAYFDSRVDRITPTHLLAATAFIPAFAAVQIDDRWLGDAGLHCNLPLDPLLSEQTPHDQLCIAIDLFDARGQLPASVDAGLERAQELLFGSQTARTIAAYQREYALRYLLAEREAKAGEQAVAMQPGAVDLLLMAYRPGEHELGVMTMDFSAASLDERWKSGSRDMEEALGRLGAGREKSRRSTFTFHDCRKQPQASSALPARARFTVKVAPEPGPLLDA